MKLFIGFLVLTALIAMITVLTGKFGEIQMKILATTLTISAVSICSMSCAAFIDRKRIVWLGLLGILLSVSAAIMLIIGMWWEIHSDAGEKVTISLSVFAVAFAFAFLLVFPKLDDRQKWVQLVSSVSIGIFALQAAIAIWCEHYIKLGDWYFRLVAAVAIVVGLETIVIPILMKLRKGDERKIDRIILEKIEGDVYRDTAGRKYRLMEMDTEPAAKTDS